VWVAGENRMNVGVLYSRVRVEEKLLLEEFERRRVPVTRINDGELVLDLNGAPIACDVVLERCVSHSRGEYTLRVLEDMGISTVNRSAVVSLCGDKVRTSSTLARAGVPTPRTLVAFTPESALTAIEDVGYPAVLKPADGSWGRLLSLVTDRHAAETVLEHKAVLGSYQHSIFYIQEYIAKPQRDIRVTVIGDKVVSAIYRYSDHWVTNTHRGSQVENCPLTDDIAELSLAAARAVGGGILAIDLLENSGQLLVNEINPSMEFRSSIEPSGVNIPGAVVEYVLEQAEGASTRFHAA
jgi:[lysine-biosynthesis-protein LysW]---L-2-aminoadipate ligase